MDKKDSVIDIYRKYGHNDGDLTLVEVDDASFLRREQNQVVVCVQDELAPLLEFRDGFRNHSSDISLLLNKRRLENSDPKMVADMIRKRFVERGGSSSVFDGLTDEQIFSSIKSRHIQTMSELDSYSEYLASSLGDVVASRVVADSVRSVEDKISSDGKTSSDDKSVD